MANVPGISIDRSKLLRNPAKEVESQVKDEVSIADEMKNNPKANFKKKDFSALGEKIKNFGELPSLTGSTQNEQNKASGEEETEDRDNIGHNVEWVLYTNDVKSSARTTIGISDLTQATLRKLKEISNSNETYAILDNIVKDFVDRNRKEIKKIEREMNKKSPKGYL